jgi:hypothetical protein
MFTILKPNVITSDEGFSVEIMGRTGIQYQDCNSIVAVDGEALAGPAGFMIYRESVRIIGPSKHMEIKEAERDVIIENIRRAFEFRGFDIEIL